MAPSDDWSVVLRECLVALDRHLKHEYDNTDSLLALLSTLTKLTRERPGCASECQGAGNPLVALSAGTATRDPLVGFAIENLLFVMITSSDQHTIVLQSLATHLSKGLRSPVAVTSTASLLRRLLKRCRAEVNNAALWSFVADAVDGPWVRELLISSWDFPQICTHAYLRLLHAIVKTAAVTSDSLDALMSMRDITTLLAEDVPHVIFTRIAIWLPYTRRVALDLLAALAPMSPRALDALLAYLASPAAPQCWTREHGQLQGQAQDQRDYTEFCEPGEEREAAKVALLAVVRAAADDNLTEVKRNAIYAIIDLPHFPAAINLFADNDTQLFTLLLHLLHLSASRTHPNQIHLPPHLSPHVLFETFVAHPAHHDSSFLVDLVIAEPVLLEYLLAYLRFAAVTSSKTPERSVSVLKTFANEVQLLDRRGLFPFRPDPILVRINALLKPQS